MPTLSEVQEHAADAEHQAFQRAYDALLDIAKDPITCRHFWDAGFTAGQADANDMLTVAHMDGYSKGRDAMRAELARQEPVAWISRDQLTCKDRYGPLPVQSLNPLGFKHTKLYTHPMPTPDVRELVEALEAVVPPMPPTDAFCHNHITTQDKCPNCQRLARAHDLLAKHRGQS